MAAVRASVTLRRRWLRTNGVNTNGVTAKILFVDRFEQVLKEHVWEMTQF